MPRGHPIGEARHKFKTQPLADDDRIFVFLQLFLTQIFNSHLMILFKATRTQKISPSIHIAN